MAAKNAGLAFRTVHGAASQGLIEIMGGGGTNDRPIEISEAEAERIRQAAELSRRYGLAFTAVLRAQLDGRISEIDGLLRLEPLPDQQSEVA